MLLYFLGDTGLSNMSRHLMGGNTATLCDSGFRAKVCRDRCLEFYGAEFSLVALFEGLSEALV